MRTGTRPPPPPRRDPPALAALARLAAPRPRCWATVAAILAEHGGTMRRQCLDCPTIITSGSRCPACQRRYRSGFSRRTLPPLVKARDGWQCQRCGATDTLRMHHIIPLARGGTDDPANLITLCHACHEREHHAHA